jgi:mannose-6-phosphate isomerase
MTDYLVPSRIEPRYMTRIWGARWLDPVFAEPEELPLPVGEVWLTGEDCRLLDGPAAGRSLADAWEAMPPLWKGTRIDADARFPILAKFLFPKLKLSIQVHPDDAYAARHEKAAGGRGKTEMWHAVAAHDEATVFIGLEEGMTPETLRRVVANGTVEGHLRQLPVAPGDTFFVPAGTVHTIGPEMVLCEIQEYSDLTYRLFDYDREGPNGLPRELHLEKAMDVVHFGNPQAGKTAPLTRYRGPLEVSYLAACPYFATERWTFVEPVDAATSEEHFDVLIFLGGQGKIVTGEIEQEYHHGEAWFLPANLGDYRLVSAVETALLRTYVPDLESLARELRKEGATRAQIAGFLFP